MSLLLKSYQSWLYEYNNINRVLVQEKAQNDQNDQFEKQQSLGRTFSRFWGNILTTEQIATQPNESEEDMRICPKIGR